MFLDDQAAGALDSGDEAVHVKAFEQAGNAGGLSARLRLVACDPAQTRANVPIGKAVEKMLSAQDGSKEVNVILECGIEAPIGAPLPADGPGQGC